MFRDLLAICLLSITVGCVTNPPKTGEPTEVPVPAPTPSPLLERKTKVFNPEFDIGSIDQGERCIWLRILNDTLIPGDTVQVIKMEHPQEIVYAKVVESIDCPESKKSAMGEFVIDSETNKEIVRYQIELAAKRDEFDFHLGIAIVNTASTITVKNGVAELDMLGKTPMRFRECTSNEGLHLTAWEGRPLGGKRIWHAYQHLFYDTEPTCNRKDYE